MRYRRGARQLGYVSEPQYEHLQRQDQELQSALAEQTSAVVVPSSVETTPANDNELEERLRAEMKANKAEHEAALDKMEESRKKDMEEIRAIKEELGQLEEHTESNGKLLQTPQRQGREQEPHEVEATGNDGAVGGEQVKAATKIQARFRGNQAREEAKKKKKDKKKWTVMRLMDESDVDLLHVHEIFLAERERFMGKIHGNESRIAQFESLQTESRAKLEEIEKKVADL